MNKTMKLLIGTFVGVGLIFLLVGGGLRIGFQAYARDFVPVQGRITGFRYGNPIISYTYNGYEGELTAHSRASWQRVGDRIEVYVDPAQPATAADGTLPLLGLIFMLIGGATLIVPAVMLAFDRRASQKLLQLSTYGQRVTVTIDAVKPNLSISMGKRHPMILYAHCRHPLTGAEITVHSRSLWRTSLQAGDQVDVLFDPMNEKSYAMDVQEDA